MVIRGANTIIAGVNKAGTTSLFVSLQAHPQVAISAVKETRYFLPARYGRPLEPPSVYAAFFADAGDRPVRLEATPAYFYGGEPLVAEIVELLGADTRIIVVLREPVARLLSFFSYQKTRLRLRDDMTLEDYLGVADAMTDAEFTDPDNEKWFGFRGGCYADFLPPWTDAFGDKLRIVFFDDLMGDPRSTLRGVGSWLGIDADAFDDDDLSSENRTTGFRSKSFQRAALAFNDRLERLLRRHPELKRRLRAVYYRLNGSAGREALSAELRAELEDRYREPNAGLVAQLREMGIADLPSWLRVEEPPSTDEGAGSPRPRTAGIARSDERSERDQKDGVSRTSPTSTA